jgi:hypothetical protein
MRATRRPLPRASAALSEARRDRAPAVSPGPAGLPPPCRCAYQFSRGPEGEPLRDIWVSVLAAAAAPNGRQVRLPTRSGPNRPSGPDGCSQCSGHGDMGEPRSGDVGRQGRREGVAAVTPRGCPTAWSNTGHWGQILVTRVRSWKNQPAVCIASETRWQIGPMVKYCQ